MLSETDFKKLKLFKRGKVRDVYDLGDKLLIVATDRISCFDVVLSTPIPDKGKILTQLSLFWFSFLGDVVENHLISAASADLPRSLNNYKDVLDGRFMIAKKCGVIPFECVVRGYISGSAWKEYKQSGMICGDAAAAGLKESQKLAEPIFTPAIKADTGHDQNVNYEYMKNKLGESLSRKLCDLSLAIYEKASGYAQEKGIIIADTKFEFGVWRDKIILIDEVLTPDSSRFWDKSEYRMGEAPKNFDKQFVRDYLESLSWDKQPPAPALPPEIVVKTHEKYKQVLKLIVGAGTCVRPL